MRKHLLLLWIVAVFGGCQPSGDTKYVSLEEVKYIKDFPYDEELKEIPVNVDEIGLFGVRVVGDSLLILGHGNNWSIHSIDGKKSYGRCLSTGQGPDEFLYLPYIRTAAFENLKDSLWAYIPDGYKNRIMAFNITEFINNGNQIIIPQNSKFLKGDKWGIVACNGSSYHMLEPLDDFSGLKRMYVDGDTLIEIPGTQSLSAATVEGKEAELNLLATSVRYMPDINRFVEVMVGLNQINVYSLDGISATTICVGDKLDDLAKLESSYRYIRPDTYKSSCVNSLGFGAIYSGHTRNPLESQNTEIQFFNWALEPVYRFKQSFEASALDLDITHKRLWIVDKDEDVLRCYDATPIIKAYEKNTRS